jgi:hypothetical protein
MINLSWNFIFVNDSFVRDDDDSFIHTLQTSHPMIDNGNHAKVLFHVCVLFFAYRHHVFKINMMHI